MQIANTIASKLIVASVAIATIFAVAMPAQAQTIEELQDMIADLMAQVAALSGGSSSSAACTFTMSLTVGAQGAEVTCLQNYLIGKGFSIPAGATGYFGAQTQAAVAAWQSANGVSPAAGYFGPVSQAKYKAIAGTGTTPTPGTPSGDLEGGAGSIESTDILSGLNNEEVGEGDEDVEVAGLEVEADDGSDLEITAVRIAFADQGTANNDDDLDEYADEVSIWLDGEEFGRFDADDFNDDNTYTKTVTLDDGAIIKAGETGEIVVAVSGLSNIDDASTGDSWSVDFETVRFRDAQDATVTETVTENPVTFTFESFATAADLEFKVSSGDDEINDARSIAVSSTTETDGVEILSFEIELEGNSDVVVDDIVVDFATSTGDLLSDLANAAELVVDGDVIGSESITTSHNSTGVVTFDNLDWDVSAGDTIEVIVRVDMNELNNGTFAAGATLSASVDPDTTGWDIEDEEGDDLAAADKTGSASGEAHAFYGDGINVAFVSATEVDNAVDSTNNDYVTLTLKFDVTAFGEDAYVDKTVLETGVSNDGTALLVEESDGTDVAVGSSTVTITSTGDEGTETFLVEEGETETFTVKVIVSNDASATLDNTDVRFTMTGIGFSSTNTATEEYTYTSNLSTDFKTDYAHIAD